MAEEDESIIQGSELHKYLTEIDYTDFEPLNFGLAVFENPSHIAEKNHEESSNICIQEHCYRQIEFILKSTLLFPEDVDIVDTYIIYKVNKSSVCMKRVISYCLTLVGVTVYTLLHKRITKIWRIPSSIALFGQVLYSGHLIWQSFHHILSERQLLLHISILKNICDKTQKLLQFLKESEIIFTGKVQPSNVGCISYFQDKLLEAQPSFLSPLKTLPELRLVIAKRLMELSIALARASYGIYKLLPIYTSNNKFSSFTLLYNVIGMKVNLQQSCIPLTDLNRLNETYLLIQSEYLKNVSLCYCNSLYCKTSDNNLSFIYKSIQELNKNHLNIICNDLQLQYLVHLRPPCNIFKKMENPERPAANRTQPKISNTVQNELHNVYLQLQCLFYILETVEDHIQNKDDDEQLVSYINEHHLHTVNEFSFVFDCIKNSLMKINNIARKPTNSTRIEMTDESTTDSENKPITKIEKIHLGESDFEIKAENVDVFVGVSDSVNNEVVHNIDHNCEYKENVNLRINILKELKMNLQARKSNFDLKEKLALEKKGLTDSVETHSEADWQPKLINLSDNISTVKPESNVTRPLYPSCLPPPPPPSLSSCQVTMFSDEIQQKFHSWGLANREEEFISNINSDSEEDSA